jgi:hypothetical protein
MHYPPTAFGVQIFRLAGSGQAAGGISLVSAVTLPDDKVITAVRDGDGDLKLISWTLLPRMPIKYLLEIFLIFYIYNYYYFISIENKNL